MSRPLDVKRYLKGMPRVLAGLPEDLRRQELETLRAYLERAAKGLGRCLSEDFRARHQPLLEAEIARYEEGARSDAEKYRTAMSNLEGYKDTPELAEPSRRSVRRQFEIASRMRRDILKTYIAGMERELQERGF